MADVRFTDEEVAAFVKWYERMPSWTGWLRRRGEHGEDVIEVKIDGPRPQTLKLARSQRLGYMVTGFDGWALTVCDEFAELLGILARYRPGAAVEESRPTLSLAG